METIERCDVAVVGGGPAGLTAAGDLARAGRRVVVLERFASRNQASRAIATQPRTLELLASRTVAGRSVTDRLLDLGNRVTRVDLWPGAGLPLDREESPYPFVLVTPQPTVDRLLEDYAREHGADVRRGAEVTGLSTGDAEDTDAGVTLEYTRSGAPARLRATWVVAADGAHSTMRGLLGLAFPGRTVLSSVVLADLRPASPPPEHRLTLGANDPDAFGFLAPFGGGLYRSTTWDRHHQLPDGAPVDDGEVARVLDRAMDRPPGPVEVTWTSRFHCEERQIGNYRHGRILFAGDAAHVHSPVGGQGMNTGIQDAVNLAWKLDAVLGGAPGRVLDTYHGERHPVGARALKSSGAMMRTATLHGRVARALRDTVGSRLVRLRAVSRFMAGTLSGTALRYPRTRHEHRLTGTRATPVPLTDGTVDGHLATPGFLFVRRRGSAAPAHAAVRGHAERRDDGPALLVRPDGYVAWAGTGEGWRAVLRAWTGRPLDEPVPDTPAPAPR